MFSFPPTCHILFRQADTHGLHDKNNSIYYRITLKSSFFTTFLIFLTFFLRKMLFFL